MNIFEGTFPNKREEAFLNNKSAHELFYNVKILYKKNKTF